MRFSPVRLRWPLWVVCGLRVVGFGWLSLLRGWLRGLRCCWFMGIRTMRPVGMGLFGSCGGGLGLLGRTLGGVGSHLRRRGGMGTAWGSGWGILFGWWRGLGVGLFILLLMTGGLFRPGRLLPSGGICFLLI